MSEHLLSSELGHLKQEPLTHRLLVMQAMGEVTIEQVYDWAFDDQLVQTDRAVHEV